MPRDTGQDFCRATWEQLQFLVRVHELGRVVLISHYGCAFYAELLKRDPDGCLPTQMADLRVAARAVREWFPGMGAE